MPHVDENKEPRAAASSSPSSGFKTRVLQLLKANRYEEALEVLYNARASHPDSEELRRSVEQVKELLIGRYAQRLGGLDRIAEPLAEKPKRSPDYILLTRYIDGTSTFGDLAKVCPLGRVRTLQLLAELYAAEAEPKSEPRSEERVISSGKREPSDEDAPITRRSFSSSPPEPIHESGVPDSAATRAEAVEQARKQQERFKVPIPGETHPFDQDELLEFRHYFETGTAAFIQKRFEDAVDSFQRCLELRGADPSAQAMLRNCQKARDAQGAR